MNLLFYTIAGLAVLAFICVIRLIMAIEEDRASAWREHQEAIRRSQEVRQELQKYLKS